MRRLSVSGILRHPWFRTELSPQLISLNHDLLDLPTAVRLLYNTSYHSQQLCLSLPPTFSAAMVVHMHAASASAEACCAYSIRLTSVKQVA